MQYGDQISHNPSYEPNKPTPSVLLLSKEDKNSGPTMKNSFSGLHPSTLNTKLTWSRRKFIVALGLACSACGVRTTSSEDTNEPPLPSLSLSGKDFTKWKKTFDGRVITYKDKHYEAWRTSMPWQMWTADRKPTMIVRPNNRDSVIKAVNFARKHGVKIAIKSGGHNVSEAFLRDNSLLLDLGELQGIEVNPESKTAWVEPALWSHLLIEATAAHGLAFPVAHCASVPMGGYLLGGGVGINGNEWGSMACHSIIAVEVITADGQTIIATADQHPDIYWAVRGAGTGFFGVVTRFQLQLYALPPAIYESMYFFPLDAIEEANQFLLDIAASGVKKTELMMLMAHNPMAPRNATASERKICIARIATFANSEEEARVLLEDAFKHPSLNKALMKQEMHPASFKTMAETSVNAAAGLGFGRYAVDTVWTNKPSKSISAIKQIFAQAPDEGNHVVVSYLINPTLEKNAAFSVIGDVFIGSYAVWRDPKNDNANFSWTKKMGAALLPYAEGQYINEVDGFNNPSSIQRCYSPESWLRLRQLKNKYDPNNLFHDYQGIS